MRFRFCKTKKTKTLTSSLPKFLSHENCILGGRGGGGGGGQGQGGYFQKSLEGMCGPLPKSLILFMTKMCDIPYPIYDQPNIRYPIYDHLTTNQNPSSNQC